MILYHYSVTYQGGKSLVNDYHSRYQDAEPFILALQKGKDAFLSTYFSALYYSQLKCTQMRSRYFVVPKLRGGRRSSATLTGAKRWHSGIDALRWVHFNARIVLYLERQIKELRLRRYENCQKDATEAIFEFVRRASRADEVSRLKCVYYCEGLDEAVQLAMEDWVDCGDKPKESIRMLAVEVDESRVRKYDQTFFNQAYDAMKRNDFDTAFANAKLYFSGARTERPLIEILSDGENRMIEEIKSW